MTIDLTSRRQVGSTSLSVQPFGFGGGALGELYGKVDEAVSQATFAAAWDAGIRFYDTAAWYGRGLSEHRTGGFLRTRPRAELVLNTKVGRILKRPKDPVHFDRTPWTGGLNFEVHWDYSYDGVMRSYEDLLTRLGMDSVDSLAIHDLDAQHHGDDLARHEKILVASGIKALEELKRTGDIKAIGMGTNTALSVETTAAMVDLDFVIVALSYTLLEQDALHKGMAALARRGVSAIIGGPFAGGILATGSGAGSFYRYQSAPQAVRDKVQAIEAVCAAHSVALPAAALQFVLHHPIVVSVIPGPVSPAQVTGNIAHVTAPIPAAFWSDLKAQHLIDPEAPVPQ